MWANEPTMPRVLEQQMQLLPTQIEHSQPALPTTHPWPSTITYTITILPFSTYYLS